eukprot:UN11653
MLMYIMTTKKMCNLKQEKLR